MIVGAALVCSFYECVNLSLALFNVLPNSLSRSTVCVGTQDSQKSATRAGCDGGNSIHLYQGVTSCSQCDGPNFCWCK